MSLAIRIGADVIAFPRNVFREVAKTPTSSLDAPEPAMTVRLNPSVPAVQPAAVPEMSEAARPAQSNVAQPAARNDVFAASATQGNVLDASPATAAAVPQRSVGFEANDVAAAGATANAAATPKYDPAGNLFPALNWLDPAKYQLADPSRLPYQQPSEMQHMLDAQASRTPEQTAIALDLAHRGAFQIWMDYADQYAQQHPIEGTLLKAKLALAIGADGVADVIKKQGVNEPRPFQVNPQIEKLGGDPGGSSYPSGHSASAYAAATVLAEAMPDRANEFFTAAANVARSRVYLGVHFPGDVAAGAKLGQSVGEKF